jgi:Fe-S cluster assembly protein SufD
MTETTAQLGFSRDAFEAFLAQRDEPSWLSELRRDAFDDFEALAWPARNEEEWIRTDIRLFKPDRYAFPVVESTAADLPQGLLSEGVDLAGHCTSLDGVSLHAELSEEAAAQGVVFGSMDQVLAEHGDKIKPYLLTKAVDRKQDRFAALHAAGFACGAVLFVPRGVVLKKPVHTLNLLSDGGSDFSHILVILEDGAEATVLSECQSLSEEGGGFHCGATELIVGKEAHLRFVNLQDWGSGVWHFAHQKAVVDRDATLQWTLGALGGKLAKVNQHVALVGDGASCQVNGAMFTEGKQHLSYHTLQHHKAAHCRSDLLYKTALQDKSRTVWRGMIKVDKDAQVTDGFQRNDNLLLSTKARADSIPGLEIEADNVRCTHGSTTGKVDEQLIFYAQARGFTRKEAVRAIVIGFFQQIFDRITIDSVRDALGAAIARHVREYE